MGQSSSSDSAELLTGLGIYCSTLGSPLDPGANTVSFTGSAPFGGCIGTFSGTVYLVETSPCAGGVDPSGILDQIEPGCTDPSGTDVVLAGDLSLDT
jgi:hypothetical protein